MTSTENFTPIPKSPLGITPRFILAERRLDEIDAARCRYIAAGVRIPDAWVAEYNELREYLRGYFG